MQTRTHTHTHPHTHTQTQTDRNTKKQMIDSDILTFASLRNGLACKSYTQHFRQKRKHKQASRQVVQFWDRSRQKCRAKCKAQAGCRRWAYS